MQNTPLVVFLQHTPTPYIKNFKVYAAPHQMFRIIYKPGVNPNNLKETKMFDFEKQYKDALDKFETITKQTKEAYEFWYNCVMDTWKDLYSKKK